MNYRLLQPGPMAACCYLVWDEQTGSAVLIDPGAGADALRRTLDTADLRLRHIFLTHLHYDHIGAVDALRDGDVRVWLCRRELENDTCISHGLMDLSLPLCFYDEGDEIAVDSLRFAVLATPGHTPGSVCLRCGGLLFTGDTLIAGSCGRVDFPGGSGADMLVSLRRLAALDGSLTVLSGHAAPTTLAHERQTNPFMLEALR